MYNSGLFFTLRQFGNPNLDNGGSGGDTLVCAYVYMRVLYIKNDVYTYVFIYLSTYVACMYSLALLCLNPSLMGLNVVVANFFIVCIIANI